MTKEQERKIIKLIRLLSIELGIKARFLKELIDILGEANDEV